MKDIKAEIEKRVEFIKQTLKDAGAGAIVYGNSGGKDCTLVGVLFKMACDNTVGIIMPCESSRNYGIDREHALKAASLYGIKTLEIDLTSVKKEFVKVLEPAFADGIEKNLNSAKFNINPRLRMITLYAYAQAHNALVAGTGNRSERYMGYFTKWGDGACDFNPIADLTVGEIYEMLRALNAPVEIIDKAPSAGLFEGQTDEDEMGVTYKEIDSYILSGQAGERAKTIIESAHKKTGHKRELPKVYRLLD